jgi:TatD DNase family protein
MVDGFLKQGAYFSFSPYFLNERKAAQRAVFARIPLERLLVETDAPDMAPPPELNLHPLSDADGKALNHPANLSVAYQGLAAIRQLPLEMLSRKVRENFERFFGPQRR